MASPSCCWSAAALAGSRRPSTSALCCDVISASPGCAMVYSSACLGRVRVADAGCVCVGWVDLDLDDGVALADPPDDAPAGVDVAGAPLGRVVEHHDPVRVAEI